MEEQDLRRRLGVRVRELRDNAGYSQADLAAKIGMDGPALSRIERGERGMDTLVLRRLAQTLETSMDVFLEPAATEVVLARADTDNATLGEMVIWARNLRSDIDAVEDFDRAGRAG
jgi:transcriptional regulator with XRE-family HTH domain